MKKKAGVFLLVLLGIFQSHAQRTTVSGKVTETTTGSPIPFATVLFKGTSDGAITDFEGNFKAVTSQAVDSIEVSYVGYITKLKSLRQGINQAINFQLDEDIVSLNEVVITPGENPAFAIMRNVIENKKKNDKRGLSAYEYESYTRTEFDIDNISDKMKNRKMMTRIRNVLDSIEQIAGEDGRPILPVFISEAISRFYYIKNPQARHERVLRTRVSGIGIDDGTLTSQVIGSSFQEYNFYQNWMNIVTKEFASPIADGWKLIYEYELVDSLFIADEFCYQLDFFPKQAQDLAFTGTMWITKKGYALKQMDAEVPKTANINFLKKIKIQQVLHQTKAGPWLPSKTRVIIDSKQLTPNTAGVLAKFYVSNKDFIIDQPKNPEFYLNKIAMDPLVREEGIEYWKQARHDSLSTTEEHVFQMIDSLKQIPQIKFMTNAIKFAATGYYSVGKLDLGPYVTFLGNNNVEGFRVGMGARTNINFSKKYVIGGYVGYGFDDKEYKYNFYTYTLLNRRKWTTLRYDYQKEIEQIWLLNQEIAPNSLFYGLSRFGTLTQPFLKRKNRVSLTRQVTKGLNTEVSLKNEIHTPLFDFNYFTDDTRSETDSQYELSEASVNIRYGKDEVFVVNDNSRLSLGTVRSPLFKLKYTYGFDDVLGSDFTYHKLQASVDKKIKMGVLGVTQASLGGGYFIGEAPYSMLFNAIGNRTPFYVDFAYNLMDYFEFSSDRYIELKLNHSFEGFLLNRIPLMRKLKWRGMLSANALLGDLDERNIAVSQFETDMNGNRILPFRRWSSDPYVEVGYGISNIFRVLSVQAFHRLTYLDDSANDFGVKFNLTLDF